ncbi:hypothetical protein [Actinoallomurus iriomotensis]|uniref:Lytic transglycosylase domain-containing protein n=1 Tax=Actinoallomurus iriomotensis TaxID=478107 RepID=A0A9W6RZ39_9ACTN|nr:hypothetical protein [Actinoallomurus iriomotensis]GLY84825.1 hypothetical protein Airi02_027540 [Actinoallomurus iriomotensis]
MYGDQFRSPGRDDRQDGADPQQVPWETGSGPVPAPQDDLKVAGAPLSAPSAHDDGGYDETPSYDTGAFDPSGYAHGAPDGNATAAYDMGETPGDNTAHDIPVYQPEYEPEPMATSAMPPYGGPGPDPALTPDFEGARRSPSAGNKRLIRFAAVAAAVAVVGGGGVAWAVTSGSSSSGHHNSTQQVQAQAPPPAPLTDAQRADAAKRRQKELKKRASRAARNTVVRPKLLAKGTPPPKPKPSTPSAGNPVPAGEAQRIARSLLPSYGWSPSSQFGCLVNLWNRESGWNVHAANPSGAYGIPQAKPGSKMAGAGPDWQNNATTQIKWGLGYIKDRYSTPCGAWSHSQSTGWY